MANITRLKEEGLRQLGSGLGHIEAALKATYSILGPGARRAGRQPTAHSSQQLLWPGLRMPRRL